MDLGGGAQGPEWEAGDRGENWKKGEGGVMDKLLKPGDPCPCCGQPILTHDPDKLLLLSLLAERKEGQHEAD